jgi:UDP-N-acetylglucosamine--N-acetylmuramyl-(pentapeptide) pyrophosphoryl-undecaprenol N-acetylglucosamine transferase
MRQAYNQTPFKARVEAFVEDMGIAYQWADLVICRAGALTISELAQMGVPSILIPYPHAVDDHQTFNARFLADKGGAIFLPQTELTVEELAMLVNQLIDNPTRLQKMSEITKSCATPTAVQQIIEICLKVMN